MGKERKRMMASLCEEAEMVVRRAQGVRRASLTMRTMTLLLCRVVTMHSDAQLSLRVGAQVKAASADFEFE